MSNFIKFDSLIACMRVIKRWESRGGKIRNTVFLRWNRDFGITIKRQDRDLSIFFSCHHQSDPLVLSTLNSLTGFHLFVFKRAQVWFVIGPVSLPGFLFRMAHCPLLDHNIWGASSLHLMFGLAFHDRRWLSYSTLSCILLLCHRSCGSEMFGVEPTPSMIPVANFDAFFPTLSLFGPNGFNSMRFSWKGKILVESRSQALSPFAIVVSGLDSCTYRSSRVGGKCMDAWGYFHIRYSFSHFEPLLF